MGCQFNFARLKAASATAAEAEGQALIEQALYECGHGGYTGSFAECVGVEVRREIVPAAQVEAWLDGQADKWGPLVVVQADDGHFYAGANCSS